MQDPNDPKLLDALRRIFPSRDELRPILEYQQRLFASLQDLSTNHRAVHEHVRNLTESHNRNQGDTNNLTRAQDELTSAIRSLDASHRQTQSDIKRAVDAISFIQQEARKVPQLEDRIEKLEREVQRLWQEDKQDEREDREQDQRLRKLETKR